MVGSFRPWRIYEAAPGQFRLTMGDLIEFKTNFSEFNKFIEKYAAAALLTFDAAFEAQGRELCNRLMQFTPPLSGHSIKRGLWNRDIQHLADYKAILIADNKNDLKAAFEAFSPFRDPSIEDLSAKKIGERRVEKDIRRVIKGVRGAMMPQHQDNPTVIVSQTNPRAANHDIAVDWGVRQKCQGRDAIRIYADRSGNVYGVDTEKFMPNPSNQMLNEVHEQHRGHRGRVTTAGSADLVTGRWRWLNIVVAPEKNLEEYIKRKQWMVGQAKGGWAAGFKAFGGNISAKGWVGRHIDAGTVRGWPNTEPGVINVTITNHSAWAGNGDPDRVIQNAVTSRERDMEQLIVRILEKRWGEGAAHFDKQTGRITNL